MCVLDPRVIPGPSVSIFVYVRESARVVTEAHFEFHSGCFVERFDFSFVCTVGCDRNTLCFEYITEAQLHFKIGQRFATGLLRMATYTVAAMLCCLNDSSIPVVFFLDASH